MQDPKKTATLPQVGTTLPERPDLSEVLRDPRAIMEHLSEAMRADEARRREAENERAQRALFDMD